MPSRKSANSGSSRTNRRSKRLLLNSFLKAPRTSRRRMLAEARTRYRRSWVARAAADLVALSDLVAQAEDLANDLRRLKSERHSPRRKARPTPRAREDRVPHRGDANNPRPEVLLQHPRILPHIQRPVHRQRPARGLCQGRAECWFETIL